MNEMLERVRELNGKENEKDVEQIITAINEIAPSVKSIEAVLKIFKNELRQILTKDLLEWMQENDQTSFETEDLKVTTKTYVSPKMMNEKLGFNWLQERGYGDLIKDTLNFPKGEVTEAVETAFEKMGLSYTKKSAIHPQSLAKIMRDRLASGEDLPFYDEEDLGDGIRVNYHDECVVKEK